jgi:hypothetical protein
MPTKTKKKEPVSKGGKVAWEDTIGVGRGFSSYMLEKDLRLKAHEAVVKGFNLVRNSVRSMNTPHRILLSFTGKGLDSVMHLKDTIPGMTSMVKKGTYKVILDTEVFATDALPSIEHKLDVFIGIGIHEVYHVLYTDFVQLKAMMERTVKIVGGKRNVHVMHGIFNIIEDARIESLGATHFPGLINFISSAKDLYFVKYHTEVKVGEVSENGKVYTEADKVFQLFLLLIRKPELITTEDYAQYFNVIDDLLEVTAIPPVHQDEVENQSKAVYDVLKKYLDKPKEEDPGDGGEGESDGESDGEPKAGKSEKTKIKLTDEPMTEEELKEAEKRWEELSEEEKKEARVRRKTPRKSK